MSTSPPGTLDLLLTTVDAVLAAQPDADIRQIIVAVGAGAAFKFPEHFPSDPRITHRRRRARTVRA